MSSLFNTLFYKPLYNAFIYLFDLTPFDAGIVIIIFTVIVKLILFPLSIKATKSQMEMKSIENDLKLIKDKYKDNKEEQTKKTVELYKEKGINPFAGIFVLLVQLPIIIGLYQVFLKSGLPSIKEALLYSFVSVPEIINMNFLSIINVSEKSIVLGLFAAITTYFQIRYSTLETEKDVKNKNTNEPDFAKMMQVQMKYMFPVLVFFISWSVSSAISIYWITSNIFTILQEVYIKKHIKSKFQTV